MSEISGAVVVVGGTRSIGLQLARHYVERGMDVVLSGRTRESADAAVAQLRGLGHGSVEGVVFDLAEPTTIAAALAGVGPVRHLALVALERDANNVRDYSIERALRLVTLKLVGFTEVVHTLVDRMRDDSDHSDLFRTGTSDYLCDHHDSFQRAKKEKNKKIRITD